MTFINACVYLLANLALLASGTISGFCLGGLIRINHLLGIDSAHAHGLSGLGDLYTGAAIGFGVSLMTAIVCSFKCPPDPSHRMPFYEKILGYSLALGGCVVGITYIAVNYFDAW